jgi:hypothetical protein
MCDVARRAVPRYLPHPPLAPGPRGHYAADDRTPLRWHTAHHWGQGSEGRASWTGGGGEGAVVSLGKGECKQLGMRTVTHVPLVLWTTIAPAAVQAPGGHQV